MFENFPKVRPVLPQEYRAIYDKHYLENRTGSSKPIIKRCHDYLEAD